MQDIQIGRNLNSQYTDIAVGLNSLATLCPPDPKRTAIIIGPVTSVCHIGPENTTPSGTVGMRLNANIPPIIIDVEHYGNLVFQRWQVFGDGGAQTISVMTSTLEAKQASQLKG